jgi:hypothetical protein
MLVNENEDCFEGGEFSLRIADKVGWRRKRWRSWMQELGIYARVREGESRDRLGSVFCVVLDCFC